MKRVVGQANPTPHLTQVEMSKRGARRASKPALSTLLTQNIAMVLPQPNETIRESNCSTSHTRTTDDDAQFSPLYTKTRHHKASLVVQRLVHLLLSLLQVSSRQQLSNTSSAVVVETISCFVCYQTHSSPGPLASECRAHGQRLSPATYTQSYRFTGSGI